MNSYDGASAAVIGGSIGGLTTALVLRELGFDVQVFERSSTPLHGRGSGIVLQPETLRWFTEHGHSLDALTTSTQYVQYLDQHDVVTDQESRTWRYTAWGSFYQALLADFDESNYHLGEYGCGFDQDDTEVTVRFTSGRRVTADLVVYADGVSSFGRKIMDPTADLTYSGYIGWRGTVPESDLTDRTRELLGNAVTYSVIPNSHIIIYPIPGSDAVGPANRLMNYVWYRNVPTGPELSEMLIDKRGYAGTVSLHPGQVQDRYVDQMRRDAVDLLAPAAAEVVVATAEPYLQVVSDVRSAQMAAGRVALIGDAACAARPHAAAGTAKAAADGWALAEALRKTAGDIPEALRLWEPGQLELSSQLLRRVVSMGERAQFSNTWDPADPDLRFGLYGPAQ